jgi:iron(III) transport system ATP-binding protein
VALARTLVVEPQVLLLDEPLSNLDKTLRVQMRQELLALQRRLGLTTIFVTHDQEEAMTTADRMAVLDQGVVQQVGTPMQLYEEPRNVFVAHFVGTMNALPVVVQAPPQGDQGAQDGWRVTLPGLPDEAPACVLQPAAGAGAGLARGAAAWLCSRPHHAVLQEPGAPATATHLWMPAHVQDREFLGAFLRYHLALPGTPGWTLQVDEPHRAGQAERLPGQAVMVGVDLSQARLLPR